MRSATRRLLPVSPKSLDDTGLAPELVYQIAAKVLHAAGTLTGSELAAKLGVSFAVVEPCLDMLRRDHHCEIVSGAMTPQSYVYRLTDAGHARAAEFAEQNQYEGPLPVPLSQYRAYIDAFHRAALPQVTRQTVREAFHQLVLSDRVLDQLGPAIASRHSLFLYGPPGNGKTKIAQMIGALLPGEIAIPHAIAVERDIVRVFDVMNHTPIGEEEASGSLSLEARPDARWVRCRRPVVTVGGELTLDSLELGFLAASGFYRAPLQTVANGGVLVIDDFGRQRCSPRDLLNRWIVPLESRIDFMTLQTGQKFDLPFMALVVFATNVQPAELVDEAFLRRIRYKVLAESPTKADFARIFENYCHYRQLAFDPHLVDQLLRAGSAAPAPARRGRIPERTRAGSRATHGATITTM